MTQKNILKFQNLEIRDGELVLEKVISQHGSFIEAIDAARFNNYLVDPAVIDRVDPTHVRGVSWLSTHESTFIVPVHYLRIGNSTSDSKKRALLKLPDSSEVGIYEVFRQS